MVYSARYQDGQTGLLQQLISFRSSVFEPAGAPLSWWSNYRALARHVVDAPGVDFAIRFTVEQNRFERLLFLLAPLDRTDEVEALAAGFYGLSAVAEDSVLLPADRAEHDRIAAVDAQSRCKVRQEPRLYNDQDIWLINDFRLFPILGDLIETALMRGWTFTYQVNACRQRPTAEDIRWSRKNLLRVAEESRFPEPLKAMQRHLDAKVASAAFLMEEFIACGEPAARQRIGELIEEKFSQSYAGTVFPGPILENEDGKVFDDDLLMGVWSAPVATLQPWEKAAAVASADELLEILNWRLNETCAQLVRNGLRVSDGPADTLKRIEEQLARIERKLGDGSAAQCRDLRTAVTVSRIDPGVALSKARLILEEIISQIYRERNPGESATVLFKMIEKLLEDQSLFPKKIASYLHTVRVLGNVSVHSYPLGKAPESAPDHTDVEITLLMLLQLIEWYLLEYRATGAPR
jgi:hypothetical protein